MEGLGRVLAGVVVLGRVGRFLFVEDTYGVEFHSRLISELWRLHDELKTRPRPGVRRLPAKKCNPKVYKKVAGILVGYERPRALVVIDSEDKDPHEAVEQEFFAHVKKDKRGWFKALAVVPRHEAWLCIGLGGSLGVCRSSPEEYLARLQKRSYEKRWLASLAPRMDVRRLLGLDDFNLYVEGLLWLAGNNQ